MSKSLEKQLEKALQQNELMAQNLTELTQQLKHVNEELALQREQNQYLLQQLFGRKKETLSPEKIHPNQTDLFEDDPSFSWSEQTGSQSEEETIEETPVRRHKKKGHQKEKLAHLPVVEHLYREENCTCPQCASAMKEMGKEVVREEVVYIPARLENHRHIRLSYSCPSCEKYGETSIIKAEVPKSPLSGSFASASLIAETIYQKFQQKVPTYRQEAHWTMMNFDIKRTNISNWHKKTSEYYFEPLVQLLKKALLEEEVLHADETTFNVLDSHRTKDYVWLFSSGRYAEKKIHIYKHGPSRGSEVLENFLAGYKRYLHSDGYSSYGKLTDVTSIGCFAHVRRKFYDALPAEEGEKKSTSRLAVEKCDAIFQEEKKLADLTVEERQLKRWEFVQPKLEEFFGWLRTLNPMIKGKIGTAISYALKQEVKVLNFLRDGRLVLSNNLAERGIKSLVMGRKNWLFAATTEGAHANAAILSLQETAKANGLNPQKYFDYLLTHLPNQKNTLLEVYLPWAPKVQINCH
ncbi:IS66 family transposase [Carnobacterium inhibens]|uniref:IS66 family transposase n=1 Tax=Carnobacterium inhibens TaxID=147709 RepID=UPI00068E97E0|nr:IS66 family transposase [Carnobacterium inhibens]